MLRTKPTTWTLDPDRCFSPEPTLRRLACELYAHVAEFPLICPHGHVPPRLLADPDATLGSPADLFVIPDHYVFRMLYSQGVKLEALGIPTHEGTSVARDHRKIWQHFADNFYLFRGTPTGLWIKDELISVFGITEKLTTESAQRIYDELEEKLSSPNFKPRALFERFNIEVLCTTDAATDTLEQHQRLKSEGWLHIRPTFRPDTVVNLDANGWQENIGMLSGVADIEVRDYQTFIEALAERRRFFKEMGATATDHAALTPHTERLSEREATAIFDRALRGTADEEDAGRFTAHMLMEFAAMSVEDGLVMQLHVGSSRNHNKAVFERFGPDKGADIPVKAEWTRALHPLLNAYGNEPNLHLILFTLDESTYSRELAPLAGHYPCLRLGPPWWFFDSVKGIERYLDNVVETAGIYNLAGFNDDTRAFASIPARHDIWRRVTCNWLAGEVICGFIDEADARDMTVDLAYRLAISAYKLSKMDVRV